VDQPTKYKTKGTPLTIYRAQKGIVELKEACRQEGRPNMCIVTPPYIEDDYSAISITHPMFMRPSDLQEIISQGFKVTYDELTRAVHYKTLGVNSLCTQMGVMGGITAASPEQFAIELVAQGLKVLYAYSSSAYFKYPTNIEYAPSASLDTLRASFVSSMALSRNTRQFHGTVVHNSAGPCTKMMMYETAIQTIGYTVCGDDMLSGPVASGGRIPDYTGGLDAQFMAEVADIAKRLSLTDADFVCKEIYEKYKYKIEEPDIGFSFTQCYDIDTIEPSDEYYKIYNSVINDLYDILSSGPLKY
jgi:methylamine--corrinoid protein Co-methyltransferase